MALSAREEQKLSRPLTLEDAWHLGSGASLFDERPASLALGPVAEDDETMETRPKRKSRKGDNEGLFLVVGILGVAAAATMSVRSPRR